MLLMIAAAPRAMAEDEVQTLIKQLGNREPATREAAIGQLRALGEAVRPELRKAAQSDSPAVADAATALLMDKRWFLLTDPPEVKQALQRYGVQPPDQRGLILQTLLQAHPNSAREAVLNVLMQDPSDAVAWQALDNIVPDEQWFNALKPLDIKSLPPGLQLFYARACFENDDAEAALPIMRRVLDYEADHPSAAAHHLLWAVEGVADDDAEHDRPLAAADRLRALLARADDQMTSRSELLDAVFDLQARFGPLQGIADDVAAAGEDLDGRAGLMLAIVASRVGAPLTHDLLIDAALADRPNENNIDRAVRLYDAGSYLLTAGQPDAAEYALTQVTQITDEPARGYVTNAYLRLSDLYASTNRFQLAGDSLQRGLNRLPPQSTIDLRRPNGELVAWPAEDAQGHVYWLYYQLAKQNNDQAAMRKEADLVMSSGSNDSSHFLDVLETLQTFETPAAIDAYFDRVYQAENADLAETPNSAVKLNDLAWLCGRSNRRLHEAAHDAERALKLKPNEAAYLDTLAEIRFRLGSIKQAIDLETRASALEPKLPFMHEQLARFRKAATTRPNQ